MEEKSKSEKKREMTALQELGKRLLELSPEQLSQLAVTEEIQESLNLYRNLTSHSARARLMKHIGALMRRIDPEPLRMMISRIEKGEKGKTAKFHQIEAMRDSLIRGNDSAIEEIVSLFPDADLQKLRQMVRGARKELKENKAPKHSRSLFRYLRELSARN
jgi:ribosome-associated protein